MFFSTDNAFSAFPCDSRNRGLSGNLEKIRLQENAQENIFTNLSKAMATRKLGTAQRATNTRQELY